MSADRVIAEVINALKSDAERPGLTGAVHQTSQFKERNAPA